MIDKKYLKIIDQCEKRLDKLDDWQKGFLTGKRDGRPDNSALRDRPFLSQAQKDKLLQIEATVLKGGTWDRKSVPMKYGSVDGEFTNEGWAIIVAGYKVGNTMVRKEVPIITSWLNSALSEILRIPREELDAYINAQQQEEAVEETEEDPF